jgi:hypothetical protein
VRRPLPSHWIGGLAAEWARAARVLHPPVRAGQRAFTQLHVCDTHDVWLIHWGPGSGVAAHDHTGSAAALYVVRGELEEDHLDAVTGAVVRRRLSRRTEYLLPSHHVHEVRNARPRVATSVHVYSPPLADMTYHPPLLELVSQSPSRQGHDRTA